MKNEKSLLSKAFDILHSSFIYIFIACLIHVLFVTSTIKDIFPTITLLFIVLKIYIDSGIYGSIIEIATGEETTPHLNNFKKNAKKYWKIYALLTLIKLLSIHLLSRFYVYWGISIHFKIFNLDIVILYFLVIFILKDKYAKKLKIYPKKISLTTNHLFQLIVLYALNLAILFYFKDIHPEKKFLTNEPIAIFMYSHFLLFSYIIQLALKTYPEIEKSFNHKKELYLISPAICGLFINIIYNWFKLHPPFFVVLKALTPKTYHFKEFTTITWKERFYQPNKLVAISCYTSNSHEAYKIAKEFKKLGSTVIMGGPHVTYLPDEALQFCDSVVIGEAESIWPEVFKDYEDQNLKKKYFGHLLTSPPPEVHQELLASPAHVIKDFLETTRGCKYHCDFCTISSLSGGKIRKKPIGEVVELIKKVKFKYKFLLLLDNNIYSDPVYAKELFRALIPLKIKWGSQCSIDIGNDKQALDLAKKSGCMHLLIGYEIYSGSKEDKSGGKLSLANKYTSLTKEIKKIGIPIKAHFIFGFDSDKLINLFYLWKFCVQLRLPFASFSLLTPLPGSKLYSKLFTQDRIINYNWRNYDLQHAVFEHKTMKHQIFKISFFLFRYLAYFTTNTYGHIVILIILADAIFFDLEHFLF